MITLLPVDMRCAEGHDAKAILEAAGLKFLGKVDHTRWPEWRVELPAGWQLVNIPEEWGWSALVDHRGRTHAKMYAHFREEDSYEDQYLELVTRFSYYFFDRGRRREESTVAITDGDKPIPIERFTNEIFAIAWLDKHYPDWRNPGAYWD